MLSRTTVLGVLFCTFTFAAGALAAGPQGGVFIPRNGGVEGRIGQGHIYFESRAGGVMSPSTGEWPKLGRQAVLDLVFAIKAPGAPAGGAAETQVRQSFDANPDVLFLEEGSQRIGLRVRFRLYDRANTYYGHGMTETWIYPDGQTFVAVGATLENLPPGASVADAAIEVKTPGARVVAPAGLAKGAAQTLDDRTIPGRLVLVSDIDATVSARSLAIYWRTGKMEHNDFIGTVDKRAPYYYRWPDFLRQTYLGVQLRDAVAIDGGLKLRWPVLEGKRPLSDFSAVFRLAPVAGEAAGKALVDAEREPVKLRVAGGVIHGDLGGYNDQEGAYEVRKTGAAPLVVTLPADPAGRTVRLKLIGLTGHGAVTTMLNGGPVVPQLSSDGGVADDPLAPIHEHPEAPADTAVVGVKLTDKPQTLTLNEQDGVQFVYQCRDPGRHVAVYSTKIGPTYAGLRFSLADGHARDMRGYGKEDCALTENLMHWFSFCGFSPQQMLDQLRDFVIVKNGPDEAIFRYTSSNADDAAQSIYEVRVPANAPAMTMDVTATFTVIKNWPYATSQFFDVFPFRGVWPRDWWYAETLWLARDGRWKTRRTVETTVAGDDKLESITGGGFFGLYSSDRGNMLMLTHNFSPEMPTDYVICGNYIDYHMDLHLVSPGDKPAVPAKGYQARAQYELAIWGDKGMTREKMIEIGKKSIAAQHLVIPE